MLGAALLRRLDVQYRMHEAIMEFSSREFYEAALVADRGGRDASAGRPAGRRQRTARPSRRWSSSTRPGPATTRSSSPTAKAA